MITFIAGMAAGAGALVGLFKICCIRWERMENKSRRTRKKPAFSQKKQVGFCGDIRRNNTWMQETADEQ